MATRARERLVEAAEQLFYGEGIRAVGVERLVAVSGVGRASFYRHFTSKDDLVVTMLRGYDERFRTWLAEAVEARGGNALAVFDALADRFEAEDFRGCASINTMVEMADPSSPAHQVAAEHKEKVIDYLDGLLAAEGKARHRELAEQLMLLIDGANVTALRERTAAPAHRAKAIAESLLGD
ncbi:helix-turn-helix domain-containing protein [Saccharopolyspora hirsuta]|uniref:TetR/AcrR family transcriptional regulator n=1 Tax=Saccharopolyspora hirsuta TaxID=1837 RepID=A0A5M7C8U7_SACHI|nr:TetR/AcrR family transcriptional regulator [Saccharopolyspora hirsuta]KAA5836867.1 TetR/AcrR family transcriptional regulator [Saccharopolyspora hirsuta]